MSNTFMKLHDTVLKHGLLEKNPALGRELHQAVEKFVLLARKSQEEGSKDESPENSPAQDSPDTRANNGSQKVDEGFSSPDIVKIPEETKVTTHSQSPPDALYGGFAESHDLVPQLEVASHHESFSFTSSAPASNLEMVTYPTVDNASFPFQESMEHTYVSYCNPPPPQPNLALPQDYSFREATFGRRLQRYVCQAALGLAVRNSPASVVQRVFGFSLQFETIFDIRNRLRAVIDRTEHESMRYWNYPFHNLGGNDTRPDLSSTGTNGRYGNQGTEDMMRPRSSNGFSMGPMSISVACAAATLDSNFHMTEPGPQGEFISCDEVEAYLIQRGLNIPPGKDELTTQVDLADFDDANPHVDPPVMRDSTAPSVHVANFPPPASFQDVARAASLRSGSQSSLASTMVSPPPHSGSDGAAAIPIPTPLHASNNVWGPGGQNPYLAGTPLTQAGTGKFLATPTSVPTTSSPGLDVNSPLAYVGMGMGGQSGQHLGRASFTRPKTTISLNVQTFIESAWLLRCFFSFLPGFLLLPLSKLPFANA
jgi:hypothetical protein